MKPARAAQVTIWQLQKSQELITGFAKFCLVRGIKSSKDKANWSKRKFWLVVMVKLTLCQWFLVCNVTRVDQTLCWCSKVRLGRRPMPLLLFQGYFHSVCQLALPFYSLETQLWNMMSSRVIIWRHLNYDCAGLPSIRLYINVLTCFWEGGLIDFITKWHFNIRHVQIICPRIESAGSCFVDTDFSSSLRLGFPFCPVFQCTGAWVLLFFWGLDRYRVEKTAAWEPSVRCHKAGIVR